MGGRGSGAKPGNNNGGGRKIGSQNRVARDLAELCRKYTKRSVGKIVKIMEAEDTPPGVALQAAAELLDRGYGKARQEHIHRLDPAKLTDDELEYLVQIEARLSGIAGTAGGAGSPPLIEGTAIRNEGGPVPAGEPGEVQET